jgi:hypothetical protein
LVEVAKIAGGGVIGILLALAILKFGLQRTWFGAADEATPDADAGQAAFAEAQQRARRSFARTPNPRPRPKHPAPAAEVKVQLQAEIDAAFAEQISRELPDDQQRNLARRMVQLADEARDRPDERFMLLVKAAELAIDAGDLHQVSFVIGVLDGEYQIDANQLTETWLLRFAESADEAHEIEALAANARPVIDRALAEDRYDNALTLAEATLTACQRPAGEKQRRFVQQGRDRIARIRDGWPEYQAARTTLIAAPEDPQANFIAGRWLCLEKDAWNGGLLYLAKGGEHPLAEAARLDRAVASGPVQPERSLEIADCWFDLAMADEAHRGCLGRAYFWYQSAQGALSGEQATHADQRLDAIFQEAAARGLVDPEDLSGAFRQGATRD